ncbi:MAG: copper transporter [Coriobacteriia bacterium]|nr:copper transporter [Coriobacteriia bacterium]
MYNLRYHIVSIMAVFLALALGLVLGGLIGDKSNSSIQASLVSGISQQLSQIREESAQVNTANERLTAFGTDSLTLLSKDRLTGDTVLVIGASGAANKHVTQVLQQAGALVVVADINESRYKADDKNSASVKLVADLKTRYKQTDDLKALAAGFAAEWSKKAPAPTGGTGGTGGAATAATTTATSTPPARPVTAALQSDGILKLSGDITEKFALDSAVDIALGAKDAPDSFGLQLAQAFSQQNTPTIVAQMDGATSTLGSTAAGLNLGVTNQLGNPMGDWTVIAVLSGAPATTYGTLDGADQVYPPVK